MEISARHDIASDALNRFDHFDVDRNGFLNLLEVEKMEIDKKSTGQRALLTDKYLDILNLEHDCINHRPGENNYGITKKDLLTLKALSSDTDAMNNLTYDRTRGARVTGGVLGGATTMTAYAFTWSLAEGALGSAVLAVPAVVGFPVAIVGGAVVGAAGFYYLARRSSSNYYEQKKKVVDSL